MPVLRAFWLIVALPAAVVGPVDLSAFSRFAATFAGDTGFLIGALLAGVVGLVGSPVAGECSVEAGAILLPARPVIVDNGFLRGEAWESFKSDIAIRSFVLSARVAAHTECIVTRGPEPKSGRGRRGEAMPAEEASR